MRLTGRITKLKVKILIMMAVVGLVSVLPITQAAAFDWQQFKGESIRVVGCTFAWPDLIKGWLPEFEKRTGIKVQWEMYPYTPRLHETQEEHKRIVNALEKRDLNLMKESLTAHIMTVKRLVMSRRGWKEKAYVESTP